MYFFKKILMEVLSLFFLSKKKRKNIRRKISQKFNLDIEKINHIKSYLQRYVHIQKYDNLKEFQDNLPIWQLWLQGEEQAPQIVKNCMESVKHFCDDRRIIVLNKDNLTKYIYLPSYIIDKYESGIISHTHFSDIVRVVLLCEYGGTWIDSTVLLTDRIPRDILDSSLFMFSSPKEDRYHDTHLISSWFIHSSKQNNLLINLKNSLFAYWEKEERLIDYFLIHLMFKSILESSDDMMYEWRNLYHLSNYPPHILQMKFGNKFNHIEYAKVKEKSKIHKLNYKFKLENASCSDGEKTFWSILSSKNLSI